MADTLYQDHLWWSKHSTIKEKEFVKHHIWRILSSKFPSEKHLTSQVKVRNLKLFKCYGSDNIQKQFESLILSQFKFFYFISKEIAKWLKYEINKPIMRQLWLLVNRKFEQKLCTRPETASFRHINRFFNNEYSLWRVKNCNHMPIRKSGKNLPTLNQR